MKGHLEESRANPTLPEWPIAALELGCDSFSAHFLLFFGSRTAELIVSNAGLYLTPGAPHRNPAFYGSRRSIVSILVCTYGRELGAQNPLY